MVCFIYEPNAEFTCVALFAASGGTTCYGCEKSFRYSDRISFAIVSLFSNFAKATATSSVIEQAADTNSDICSSL